MLYLMKIYFFSFSYPQRIVKSSFTLNQFQFQIVCIEYWAKTQFFFLQKTWKNQIPPNLGSLHTTHQKDSNTVQKKKRWVKWLTQMKIKSSLYYFIHKQNPKLSMTSLHATDDTIHRSIPYDLVMDFVCLPIEFTSKLYVTELLRLVFKYYFWYHPTWIKAIKSNLILSDRKYFLLFFFSKKNLIPGFLKALVFQHMFWHSYSLLRNTSFLQFLRNS